MNFPRPVTTTLLFWLASTTVLAAAQDDALSPHPTAPPVEISRLTRAPALEDFLDMQPPEDLASQLTHLEGFVQQEPEDGKPASQATHAYLGYDEDHLYVVFVAFDTEPEKIRAHYARRDAVEGDDIVEILLDTFHDQRRALSFIVNPLGIQSDAIFTEQDGYNDSWDQLWYSKGQVTDRGYVVWIQVPFKSLRFSDAPEQTWGVVLLREIPRNNEESFWPRVTNRIEGRLNQEATMTGLRGVSPGGNFQLIPYATGRRFLIREDIDDTEATTEDELDAGLDVRVGLSDAAALDLTVNPDFSQVESDEPQVTVNERFELFFPERRPFFVESSDYFETPLDLVFTRRIADPRYGARLTGKFGGLSVGALVIDDEAPGERLDPGEPGAGDTARSAVLRINGDLFEQSTIGLTYTGYELAEGWNQVGGIDGRFKLSENWVMVFQAVQSETRTADGERFDDPAYDLVLQRDGRKVSTELEYRDIGADFETELGFVPRADIREATGEFDYRFRPEGRRLVSWGPTLTLGHIEDHDGLRLDRTALLEWSWQFRRQTSFFVEIGDNAERLRVDDFEELLDDTDFDTDSIGFGVSSRFVDAFGFDVTAERAESINIDPPDGQVPTPAIDLNASVEMTLRFGRRWRINTTYLYTRLLDDATDDEIFTDRILRGRLSWQYNPDLSLRLIVQYEKLEVDPLYSSLDDDDQINGDALLTYQVNPWTTASFGYNGNYRRDPITAVPGGLTDRFNDARQVFVKFTYLIRP